MSNELIRLVRVERIDDIPMLLAHLQKMRVNTVLDELFPTHGYWKCLTHLR